jgi:hypothetical protein
MEMTVLVPVLRAGYFMYVILLCDANVARQRAIFYMRFVLLEGR